MKLCWTLALVLVLFGVLQASGQGCSDAGFCTMGAMKPDQTFSRKVNFKLRSIEISYYRGTASIVSPIIYAVTADINYGLTDKLGFQIKVPFQWVNGNFGETQGMSDISFSFTRNLMRTSKLDLNVTLGGKIPTNQSDKTNDSGLVLPMYYQTSLGSYDIIAGISMLTEKWLLAFGYQQALTANENSFFWGEWVNYPSREYLFNHDVGIGLKRGIDLMLRVERNFRFINYSFNVGLLPIYRITPDQGIILTRKNGGVVKTTGLALSAIAGFTYHLNTTSSVKFLYGYKITDRPTNPDGLTRDDVITVAYLLRF
ncbi:MAG: hypothetical protein AAGA85_03765 [Bacteroidota bacterium]